MLLRVADAAQELPQQILLDTDCVVLGRQPIAVASTDQTLRLIRLDDPRNARMISRVHAVISREAPVLTSSCRCFVYRVQDRSTNGVFVNGAKVKEPTRIMSGDVVKFGTPGSTVCFTVKLYLCDPCCRKSELPSLSSLSQSPSRPSPFSHSSSVSVVSSLSPPHVLRSEGESEHYLNPPRVLSKRKTPTPPTTSLSPPPSHSPCSMPSCFAFPLSPPPASNTPAKAVPLTMHTTQAPAAIIDELFSAEEQADESHGSASASSNSSNNNSGNSSNNSSSSNNNNTNSNNGSSSNNNNATTTTTSSSSNNNNSSSSNSSSASSSSSNHCSSSGGGSSSGRRSLDELFFCLTPETNAHPSNTGANPVSLSRLEADTRALLEDLAGADVVITEDIREAIEAEQSHLEEEEEEREEIARLQDVYDPSQPPMATVKETNTSNTLQLPRTSPRKRPSTTLSTQQRKSPDVVSSPTLSFSEATERTAPLETEMLDWSRLEGVVQGCLQKVLQMKRLGSARVQRVKSLLSEKQFEAKWDQFLLTYGRGQQSTPCLAFRGHNLAKLAKAVSEADGGHCAGICVSPLPRVAMTAQDNHLLAVACLRGHSICVEEKTKGFPAGCDSFYNSKHEWVLFHASQILPLFMLTFRGRAVKPQLSPASLPDSASLPVFLATEARTPKKQKRDAFQMTIKQLKAELKKSGVPWHENDRKMDLILKVQTARAFVT